MKRIVLCRPTTKVGKQSTTVMENIWTLDMTLERNTYRSEENMSQWTSIGTVLVKVTREWDQVGFFLELSSSYAGVGYFILGEQRRRFTSFTFILVQHGIIAASIWFYFKSTIEWWRRPKMHQWLSFHRALLLCRYYVLLLPHLHPHLALPLFVWKFQSGCWCTSILKFFRFPRTRREAKCVLGTRIDNSNLLS